MTRINSSIEPSFLSDEHLLAEHREIKRLPSVLRKSILCGSVNDIPKTFCLGKGHVLFFMDKMLYIIERYKSIYSECKKRGFLVDDYSSNFEGIEGIYLNDWIPDHTVKRIVTDRIIKRIMSSSKAFFHYKGEKISKETAVKILTNGRFT